MGLKTNKSQLTLFLSQQLARPAHKKGIMNAISKLIDNVILADIEGDLPDRLDGETYLAAKREYTDALDSVLTERKRQDRKWGEQNHDPYIYMAILVEEVGELAQAILHTQFGGDHGGWTNVRTEVVHCAAVALAMIECLDRDKYITMVDYNYPGAR